MASEHYYLYDKVLADWFAVATEGDINELKTLLDNKLDSALFTGLSNRLDNHEISLINSEQGLHGIRLYEKKLQSWDVENEIWVDSIGNIDLSTIEDELNSLIQEKLEGLETAPLEHSHEIADVNGLEERLTDIENNVPQIEITDATLTDKGIVQLSNAIDSEDETKASTPLATKTALNEAKAHTNQLTEDAISESKSYTDTKIDELNTSTQTSISEALEESKSHSDTNDLLTLDTSKSYTDSGITESKNYTDTRLNALSTSSDGKYATKTHTHTISDVNGLQSALDGKSSSSHKHSISDTADLQNVLESKLNVATFNQFKNNFDNHSHTIENIDGLTDKLNTFASTNHTHSWTQITNRPISTANSIDTAVTNMHSHSNRVVLDELEDGNGVLIYKGTPLGEASYISVNDLTERDAIPIEARKEGLMAMVLSNDTMYYLRGGIDNAFWSIFSTGSNAASTASTLPATPSNGLIGTNTQSLIDELAIKKANLSDVYTKGEIENVINNHAYDYYQLDNLPDLSGVHKHDNKETLDLFTQSQGNLVWKGKSLGDLISDVYDANRDGVVDKASTLDGMTVTVDELNKLSGISDNIQSQINSLASGSIFRGEYDTYAEMTTVLDTPEKGDWVFILNDETKNGAVNTQYLHDGTAWIYGGGSTKVNDATTSTKGIIQLGGDLAGTGSTSTSPKLSPSGVQAGLYRSANITIGEDGRITNAEDGNIVFLNDGIVSPDEGWSSEKITNELSKYAPRSHTHTQLHNANQLGSIELNEEIKPEHNQVISYDSITGKARWTEQEGGKFSVGSKSLKGNINLVGGSYISLLIDEQTNTIQINGTYREGGGSIIPTGFEVLETITVPANETVRFSKETGYNKVMLHTLQMLNDSNATGEVKLYNQSESEDGTDFIEYNSNAETFVSDIVNIPIFDYDNSKMMHFGVSNMSGEEATFTIRAKCTNLL